MVQSKELRKGTMVILKNGWEARLEDNNTRGFTRYATVFGIHEEMGSIYTTDIAFADVKNSGYPQPVQHSPSQLKAAKARAAWGF